MDRKQRVILIVGGVTTDLSSEVGSYGSGGGVLDLDVGDAFYVASELPFNHRWFEVTEPNIIEAALSVSIWNGTSFVAALDVADGTSVAKTTLAKSGCISFTPDRRKPGWALADVSSDIAELADAPIIYRMYWAKFEVTAAITVTTELLYVGQKFCSDDDLYQVYPDLNRTGLKTAFLAGKTDWSAQTIIASELIVDDLRQRRVVIRRDQIMDESLLRDACRHKTAEIIYRGLGNGHLDNRILAAKDYMTAMSKDFFEVDRTGDGIATFEEKLWSTSFGTR